MDQPPEPITRTFDPKAFANQTAAEDSKMLIFPPLCFAMKNGFDVRLLTCNIAQTPFSRLGDIELVIFCGSPSAGKSTFYWKYLEPLGYERVNQDTLKTVSVLPITYCLSVSMYTDSPSTETKVSQSSKRVIERWKICSGR